MLAVPGEGKEDGRGRVRDSLTLYAAKGLEILAWGCSQVILAGLGAPCYLYLSEDHLRSHPTWVLAGRLGLRVSMSHGGYGLGGGRHCMSEERICTHLSEFFLRKCDHSETKTDHPPNLDSQVGWKRVG